jgi:RNA-directed DNA polymerase
VLVRQVPRYADDCNIYVSSRRAGERVLESIEAFLGRLRLMVNREKRAVARPWDRAFLGYTLTWDRVPRVKIAMDSVRRLKVKLRQAFCRGRGRNIRSFIEELKPILLGWANCFRLSEVKIAFEELDSWIRCHLRKIIWRQWKRSYARAKGGLLERRARG